MIRGAAVLLALASCAGVPADAGELERRLTAAVAGFRGEVGVYVRHLPSGCEVAIRADELFPTASMIKVPIMLAVFDRIARGELLLDQELTWSVERIYPGSDFLARFPDGSKVKLDQLVLLMQTMSDNTASLWLQELAGTGTRINEWLAARGFARTRMNSRTPGRDEDWKRYGWGQTSPREMAELLVVIREARGLDRSLADEMYRSLTRSYWNDGALASIPPWVQAASKQGAVSRSRSEVVLVNAPRGDYVFCVITKKQADTRWVADNEGDVLLRRISGVLWDFFEPAVP